LDQQMVRQCGDAGTHGSVSGIVRNGKARIAENEGRKSLSAQSGESGGGARCSEQTQRKNYFGVRSRFEHAVGVKNEQASGTALLIAASLALMHADPVYSDAVSASSAGLATRVLEHYSSRSRFFINVLRGSWFRRLARLLERITVPGILRHYAMRKKCIAQVVREATEGGIGQVVILGAGFDSLGSDLHREFAHVRVWEIDHPATQKSKQLGLELIDQTRFQLVPADLSGSDLKEMLSNANGFRPDEMTIWIAGRTIDVFPRANCVAHFAADVRLKFARQPLCFHVYEA
jgi:methyltransferase (TIGR00027 family)